MPRPGGDGPPRPATAAAPRGRGHPRRRLRGAAACQRPAGAVGSAHASATRSAARPKPCAATSTCPSRWPARSSPARSMPTAPWCGGANLSGWASRPRSPCGSARDLPPRPAALYARRRRSGRRRLHGRRSSWSTTATTISPPSAVRPRSPTTRSTPACVLGRPVDDWHGLDLAALTGAPGATACWSAEGRSDALLGPPAGRAGLARHQTLEPGAGLGRRHLRQPGHDHAGAVGRRAWPLPDRGRRAGRGRGDRGLKQRNGGPAAAKRSVCRCRRLLAGAGQA